MYSWLGATRITKRNLITAKNKKHANENKKKVALKTARMHMCIQRTSEKVTPSTHRQKSQEGEKYQDYKAMIKSYSSRTRESAKQERGTHMAAEAYRKVRDGIESSSRRLHCTARAERGT